jgi:hypothetical protein
MLGCYRPCATSCSSCSPTSLRVRGTGYQGYGHWRLPSTVDTNSSIIGFGGGGSGNPSTSSEMAHLFYGELLFIRRRARTVPAALPCSPPTARIFPAASALLPTGGGWPTVFRSNASDLGAWAPLRSGSLVIRLLDPPRHSPAHCLRAAVCVGTRRRRSVALAHCPFPDRSGNGFRRRHARR